MSLLRPRPSVWNSQRHQQQVWRPVCVPRTVPPGRNDRDYELRNLRCTGNDRETALDPTRTSLRLEHYPTILNHLMAPNRPIWPGAKRGAMWDIGQALRRRQRADLAHRRPAFRARWTSLRLTCGHPDHGVNLALPADVKTRSNRFRMNMKRLSYDFLCRSGKLITATGSTTSQRRRGMDRRTAGRFTGRARV